MANQPLIRQLGNKSVPKLLEKVNYTDIVTDFSGGTGAPLAAEVGKTLYVQVNKETSDRINGDLAIIDGASAEFSTLSKIETVVKANKADVEQKITDAIALEDGKIATEATTRQAGDDALTTALNQEIADRGTAIGNEAQARQSADASLQSAISQEASDRSSAVSAEQLQRETADSALQANLDAEVLARKGADDTEKAAREAADTMLDGKIGQEKIERIADIQNVNSAIVAEQNSRVSADSVIDSRLSAIESGMATGAKLKGSVDTLADFDAFVESEQQEGWFYKVKNGTTGTSDVYMVANSYNGSYDYQPAGWTSKGFIWLMDFADVTNAVNTEKTARVAADTELDGKITLLGGVVASNKSVLESSISTLRTDMENADSVLDQKIYTEINDRTTAVTNEANARIADVETLTTNLDKEVSDRQAAITLEASTRLSADTTLQGNIDAEAAARQAAVSNEATARQNADATLQSNLDAEVTARQEADSTEASTRLAADNALSARLDVVEGSDTVDGSIKKALLDAKKYVDNYVPVPMLEGIDGTLLVVGDTVTLKYAPHRGLNGVAMGECIVYLENGDSVMVTVLNVVGNVMTLATSQTGEYAGCSVKVQYSFINADQNGAGMGVAGEGGAGL